MSKIAVTGHRPSKMPPQYGYDTENQAWASLKEKIKTILMKKKCTDAWTGMALGVDTVFAEAVLELKQEGFCIKLHCAIPCQNHSSKWPKQSRDRYNAILAKADTVTLVTDAPYKPYLMQKRNEYMTDHADELIAVWDGNNGGTKNCVEYARKKQKSIIVVSP